MSAIYTKTGDPGLNIVLTLAALHESGGLVFTDQADPIARAFAEGIFADAIERLPSYEHARQETDR